MGERSGGTDADVVRTLVLVVGAVLFVDTMLYSAIAPILPKLAAELHLSRASIGVLNGCYPAGTLIGAIPGGMLAIRVGRRTTLWTGLGLLACSTVAFGVLRTAPLLDLARFVEGLGGACSWVAGLGWIVAETTASNRGATLGRAISAGILGILCGPLVGTLASVVGRAAAFGAVGVLACAVLGVTTKVRADPPAASQDPRMLVSALRVRGVQGGAWLVALPAIAGGLVYVLAPLRLHHLGAGSAAIGASFVVAAALRAAILPAVGRLSDRRGRYLPLRCGLAMLAVGLALLTVPRTAWLLAVIVVVIYAGFGFSTAPGMALMSEAADARGLDPGFSAALMNLAWAGGQVLGSGLAGPGAAAVGDTAVAVAVALLCALTGGLIDFAGGS